MQYEKRPTDVEAMKLRYPMTIEGPNGTVHGKPGDWLVTEGERQYFMGPDEFNAAFVPKVDPPSAPPTYVPYPMPYPVYPQATPHWQPNRWWTLPNVVYGSTSGTSGTININEQQAQFLTTATTSATNARLLGATATDFSVGD